MYLHQLPIGSTARICAIEGDAAWQRRLAAFGITVNQRITLLQRAPFSNTLAVRVGALTEVVIRAQDAATIAVEQVS